MYYHENLDCIMQNKNTLYQQIVKCGTKPSEENIEVRSLPTRTDISALEITMEQCVSRLNSKYDPVQEALSWARQFDIKNLDTTVSMFGLGNGVFLRELLKRLEQDSYVIVYEPSYSVFLHVMEYYPIADILSDSRVLLVVQGLNDNELPLYVSQVMNWMNLYSRLECCHPGYDKIFKDSYQYVHATLQDNLLECLVVKGTHEKLSKLIVANSIRNILFLKNAITYGELFEQLPKHIPVIIVSAGPSLLKNIDVLNKAKGKAIIIAVDRAYEILQKWQIEPDIVANLDPFKTIKCVKNSESFTVPLLCKLEGSYRILSGHKGKKIIFSCSELMSDIYSKMGKKMYSAATGGSITTAVFNLMVSSGFQRIVLVGSDLAYKDGLSHAGMDQLPDWNNGLIELYVDDIHGNKVKTRYDWYSYLRWLEGMILQFPECDFIDATEGGAKISGTRLMTLQEVVDQYCTEEIDCNDIINHIESTFKQDEYKGIANYLIATQKDINEIQDMARKTIYDCEKLIENFRLKQNHSSESRRLVKKLFETNSKIEQKTVFLLLNEYVFSINTDDIGKLYLISSDKEKDEMDSYLSTKLIYQRILEACDFLLPVLNWIIAEYNTMEV